MSKKNNKGILLKIRKSRSFKGLAVCLALNLLFQMVQPTVSLALTEGPSQPEVQSFEPIGTTQMVNMFTGDFNYNIPLFNLPGPNGGYPVNLSYHAGSTMEDEASWVGLGWNINAGALVRNKRGLPDEFLSREKTNKTADDTYDHLEVKSDQKESWTLGITGSVEPELAGANPVPLTQISASIYFNNYSGAGVSLEPNFGIGASDNFTLGLSLDSENGLGLNAKISHKNEHTNSEWDHSFGIDFSGDLSISYSLTMDAEVPVSNRKTMTSSLKNLSFSQKGNGFSYATANFVPSVGRELTSFSLTASIGAGLDPIPFFKGKNSLSVNYQTQDFKSRDKNGRNVLVAGYANMGDNSESKYYSQDAMRHNDGQLNRGSVVLANPEYTYDTYTSSGQGLVGHFRTKRNDIGRMRDVFVRNETFGGSYGFTGTAGGSSQFEGSFGVSFGWDVQKAWDNRNPYADDFENPNGASGATERKYYKVHGEPSIMLDSDISYLDGLGLSNPRLGNKSVGKYDVTNVTFDNSGHDDDHRFVRNTLVHSLKNEEVDHLGEYYIAYYSAGRSVYDAPDQVLNRKKRYDRDGDNAADVNIGTHEAGFKVLNEQGSYYVYGLPAYNNKEVQNFFSVKQHENEDQVEVNTFNGEIDYKLEFEQANGQASAANKSHKYIDKKTTSPYAHSYMLTSIQGADYVDITNNGPTDDDLGYWVKFSYVKATDKYQWRAPYDKQLAQYHPGASYHSDDDKASYSYGEKELWYLGRMETKSHVALFILENRNDNLEAAGEYPDVFVPGVDDHGKRIKEIRVYDKKSFLEANNPQTDVEPLQTVHFEYSYELCPNIENFNTSGNDPDYVPAHGNGKLTLKRVWFTSLGSTRGEQSAYEFDYNAFNPGYETNAFDGWGVHKPRPNVPLTTDLDHDYMAHFPYTTQFDQDWNTAYETFYDNGETAKEIQDRNASAWNLSRIKLPSGGVINVEYESDDYSHVQHKVANQMFKITKMGATTNPDELYGDNNNVSYANPSSGADEVRRRIYFKLEEPLTTTGSALQAEEVFNKYVEPIIEYNSDGERAIYFKSRMRLLFGGNVWDYVSGYLPIEPELSQNGVYNYGAVGNEGFITVQAAKRKNGTDFDQYHPMSVAAWNFMQTNTPELINNPNSFDGDNVNKDNFFGKLADAFNVVPQLLTTFGGVKKYCKSKNMARYIDLSKSCIRLASPDRIKFGGGHRVKQITLSDSWDFNSGQSEDTYGQVFNYSTEENGKIISSGVAQYEPQAIGDENALKHPVFSFTSINLFSNNNLFAEMPVNEALYPGPAVGYRKVTVRSLNTDRAQREYANNSSMDYGRTGGVTVHEFYTAKEFPTIEKRTILSKENDTKAVFNVPIPIPFIGSIKRKYFHGTQSFLVETNDMHGKPKSVRTFEVNNYALNSSPITETEQEYQSKPLFYQGENVFVLDNEVDVIESDNPTLSISEDYGRLGVEVDLFTDQREVKNFYQQAGLDFGVDIPAFFIFPAIEAWPTFTNHKSLFRTFVTNKVVHRTGILKRTKSKDLQTVNESEILAYDEKSGTPLLTKVTNEFGDDFYNYNVPAYYHYDNMGHAYENINFKFSGLVQFDVTDPVNGLPIFQGDACVNIPINTNNNSLPASQSIEDYLVRGDELLITTGLNGNSNNDYRKAYFLGWIYNGTTKTHARIHMMDVQAQSIPGEYGFKVIRSGRRNHYGTSSASYVTRDLLEQAIPTTQDPQATPFTDVTSVDGVYDITTPNIRRETVLQASASLFKDTWSGTTDLGIVLDEDRFESIELQNAVIENPYLTGNAGIWRPYKSYSYVGPRKTSASLDDNIAQDPNLRDDGVFEGEVPMFTWEIGDLEEYISEWEWVNEVTRFSEDSYETENINRIGIHSSALYGYDNSLSIAVGGNAEYYELGAMDFETLDAATGFGVSMVQTNMNFSSASTNPLSEVFITEVLPIREARYNGTSLEVVTDIAFSDFSSTGYDGKVRLTLNSSRSQNVEGNNSHYFNGTVDFSNVQSINGYAAFDVDAFYCESGEVVLPNPSWYTGKVRVLISRNALSAQDGGNIEFTSDKAHTGKKSMKVLSESLFDQPMLKMNANKKYVVSLWVSRDQKMRTYENGAPVELGIVDPSGPGIGSFSTSDIVISQTTYSHMIEGWQKIDFEFYVTVENAILGIKLIPGAEPMYVDDVRFSPRTGGITTHVYDPNRLWLRASLNVDNYATLFFYDEEGNLTIKKQETEEGIFTITESRGHVSED